MENLMNETKNGVYSALDVKELVGFVVVEVLSDDDAFDNDLTIVFENCENGDKKQLNISHLCLDGENMSIEPYNIDGSIHLKLHELTPEELLDLKNMSVYVTGTMTNEVGEITGNTVTYQKAIDNEGSSEFYELVVYRDGRLMMTDKF